MLNRNLERIIASSYASLGDLSLRLARNHKNGLEGSKRQEGLWNKGATVRILLKGLESRERQEDTRVNKLLSCLVKLSDINDYPAAPVLYNSIKPTVILPQGIEGKQGLPGINGSDATVDVVEGDDTIQVVESIVNDVRTFTLSYSPYTEPSISTAIDTGQIAAPASRYREVGQNIGVPLVITVTKGREDVDTSVVTSSTALNDDYQLVFDKDTVNTNGSQQIPLTVLNVTATDTYTVNVTDVATPTPGTDSNSDTIYFNYPILYGSNVSDTINHYQLTKKLRSDGGIQPKQTTTVVFNGDSLYFYFCFPDEYGALSSIKDQNGFEQLNTSDPNFLEFTGVLVDSANLAINWTDKAYYVYRTVAQTTITNATYTFTW